MFENGLTLFIILLIAIVIIVLLANMFYIVKQWETVTLIRFGRLVKTVETGIQLKMPLIDSLIRLDLSLIHI